MFISISHSIMYYYQKKKSFCDAKVIEGPEAPERSLRALFKFLNVRMLLRVFSDRILIESSVIGSSSGSSVIYSSLGSSVLFFRHAAIFY